MNQSALLKYRAAGSRNGDPAEVRDLGRWSWLDSTDVDSAIILLKLWHDQLPAENGADVLVGYQQAKGDMSSLLTLATGLMNTSDRPEYYGLVKHYAEEQQDAGWLAPSNDTRTWLQDLAQQRWVVGSAIADTWLQALGEEPLEEVILLPIEERRAEQPRRWAVVEDPVVLDVFPNPTDGLAHLVCNVPAGCGASTVLIRDVQGRVLHEQRLGSGTSIVEVDLVTMALGVYFAELRAGGLVIGQAKVTRQ